MLAQSVLRIANNEQYDHAPMEKLAQIIELCKQEIHRECAARDHGTAGKARYNAALKYLKALEKDNRPGLAGAWIEHDYQCLCNGMTGILLSNHIDGLPAPTGTHPPLYQIFYDAHNKRTRTVEFNLADIIAHRKINGKYDQAQGNHYVIDDRWFDYDLIIDACKILGGDKITAYFCGDTTMAPMILESENGRAIVLPLRQH